MKKRLSMLMCLAALAGMPAVVTPAQELSNPVGSTATPPASVADRLRGDADDARRRESDLSAQVAEQERTNAMLRDQIRRAGNDPTGLGRDLANASDDASTLRKKVADQRQRRDAAEDKLAAARDRAMDRYEQTGPAKAARDAVEQAGAELDRLSQPIFEQLTQTPAYQEQQALVDAAAQAGEAIGGFPGADPRAQADADAAFDSAMAGLRAMEDAAISADPTAANARASLKVAQDTLDGLRRANEQKIATDPAVDAARFALDLEEKLLGDVSAQLATAEKRLSALRQAGGPQGAGDLTAQLRDGEARLRDLNDRLDQARIARRDTEDRLASVDDGRNPASSGEIPAPGYDVPPTYSGGYDTYDGSYAYGGGAYYPPTYGYGYVYPRYGPYYSSYDYCPPYFSSGLFLGLGISSYSYYRPYHHYYTYYRPYYHDHYRPYYAGGYSRDHGRNDWHNDRFRSGGHDTWVRSTPDSSRYTTSSRRYDYARFNSTEAARDRAARSSVSAARSATADAERDYRFRTGAVRTYDYPGSSRTLRDQESSARVQNYEQELQARRARIADNTRRDERSSEPARTSTPRSDAIGSSRVERSESDSAARRARAADETSRTRVDVGRPRDTGADSRSSRVSSGATRSEPGSISSSSSSDARRSRDTSSADAAAARARASEAASARARSSSDDSSARRARAAEDSSRSRGSADSSPRGGRTVERSAPTPPPSADSGRGSSRRNAPTPPPSFDSGRGSSRGSSPTPPPSFDSGRGSRSSAPAAEAPSASRGSRGGGDAPSSSRGSSPSPSRGGSSSGSGSGSDGGGRRGR